MGSPEDTEQGDIVCGQIRRLLIQSDIVLQSDGKIVCGGTNFSRIGVSKQLDCVPMLGELCHLPYKFQLTEYLPAPKAPFNDKNILYPVADFEHLSDGSTTKPGLKTVALSCCKIVAQDGRKEVVKLALVDVLNCRVLMDYLVCPEPSVKDWCTKETGLTGFSDIEAARLQNYKVFRGWQAARSALKAFIDRDTIIIGYNLRSDLDALRLIHARAVDVVKVVEKAAEGPLSLQQLSLESLCRTFPGLALDNDRSFGRNCLQDAFAIREVALWAVKNRDVMKTKAKQKALDYAKVSAA
jgi:hypothetical protein